MICNVMCQFLGRESTDTITPDIQTDMLCASNKSLPSFSVFGRKTSKTEKMSGPIKISDIHLKHMPNKATKILFLSH
uniref:Uncharacterized protein n=1 Tax=Onchocerca volvulus TaxID=6282 RepID=A0A8R1Y0C5_ONCVO